MLASDQKTNEDDLSAVSRRIIALRETVFAEWENDVRRLVEGARHILHPILINTLPVFYDNIAEALSPDHPRRRATSNNDIAAAHGNERARMTAYGPEQIIHEYQIFRDVFSRVMDANDIPLTRAEWRIVNGSIDCAVREAVKTFTSMHDTFRNRVAASLSHDMRNPLSVIVNGAHVLTLGPAPEKAPGIARKILDNGRRLGTMIEELLDALSFHRGETVPLDLTSFDLRALAEQVCADANIGAGDCSVEGASVPGYWCENSLRRALENLVSNAIKYGDGSGVRIKIDSALDRMLLSVHNDGNPIPPEHRARIFQYLWREDSAKDQRGWGIGLPFVQSVAESHGGSVTVDSSAATGTTFLIDLPVDCRPFVPDGAGVAG
jgi:signal transduction histidine kinase